MDTYTTQTSRLINAPRMKVYNAIIDPETIPQWKVPDGMSLQIHHYDAKEGGKYRISLIYDDIKIPGKTNRNVDTYSGEFIKLVPNELIIQSDVFESDDSSLRTSMISTYKLSDFGSDTLLECTHEHVPKTVSVQDNKLAWEMVLEKIAKLVEF